ncbi:MAG: tetratricopeptide repeat protein [Oscillochloris sp.]|nr:tetratricopeptide repeat protein [Oscillochloris sp.]
MKGRRAATFYDHLKRALELFDQPEALGEQSPLAAPYVLGAAIHGADVTASGRGKALGAVIERALAQMWDAPLPNDGAALLNSAMNETPPGGRYDCLILELNYLKQRYRPIPRNQAEIYYDILHISRPTHDRHLRSAVERLGATLLQLLRPAIHLEQPLPPALLVGRAALPDEMQADLAAGKTVAINGPGGIGKTALGAVVARRHPGPRFWYTFRPALNDQLTSLLFALGHFLHLQGASTLWQQLVVERGRLPEGGMALGLALADLDELPQQPLLCFDELDVLRPLAQDQINPGHVQILEFLDGLRGNVPMLTIGLRPFWDGDSAYRIAELSAQDLAAWLTHQKIPHTPADITHLFSHTQGNPRLVELCVALYQAGAGEHFAAVLEQLPHSQALLPLWSKLERRLHPDERRLLQELAVFRANAPADAWRGGPEHTTAALEQLIARRLVHEDDRGGIGLLPALREIIHAELPVEMREELHNQAAQIRAERGEYTTAAYHWYAAGQPETAIELWHANRNQEINQGQAGAALNLFSKISLRRLSTRHSKQLLLLRAELHELAGDPIRVTADLEQAEWPADDPATPEAMLHLGQALAAQGQAEPALQMYRSGLEAVATLMRQSTQLHVQRSLTQLRRREMQQAWQEANLARFHAETMLGIVHDQSGDYATAHQHYVNSLAIAEQIDYQAGIAQTQHYLAMLAGRRQDLAAALPHFEQAIAFYERVGDRVNREYVRSNLASTYIQVRRFAAALEPAEQALRFFTAMGNSVRIAQNASNLAEAHAELGNLDQAEHYAQLVLREEEPQSHPYALYTLGTVYRLRGDPEQAGRYYDQSRRIAEINDDSYLVAFAWRALGEIGRARGDETAAQQHFAQAIELFRRLNITTEAAATVQLAQCDANPAVNDASIAG